MPSSLVPGLVVAMCVLVLSSCGQPTRPSVDEWTEQWVAIQEVVPPRTELGDPPTHESCEEVLGELRAARSSLRPAPDDIIDDTAQAWVAEAEAVFYDCFDSVGTQDPVATAYQRLDRFKAEVETAIRTAPSPADRNTPTTTGR